MPKVSKVTGKPIHDFLTTKNLNYLKSQKKIPFSTIWKTLDPIYKGRLGETIVKLGIWCGISIPQLPYQMTLLEGGEKVLTIDEIGFGVKSGGCDIHAIDSDKKIVIGGTGKLKHIDRDDKKTQWGEIEWEKVDQVMSNERSAFGKSAGWSKVFLAVIGSKSDLDTHIPRELKQHYSNLVVMDVNDFEPLWKSLIDVFEKVGWDSTALQNSVVDAGRVGLTLMEHQVDCVKMGIDAWERGEKRFLIADKPRAGKTICVAEILRMMWSKKESSK